MIIRVLAALVLGSAAGVGALYGASIVLPDANAPGAAGSPDPAPEVSEEPPAEPPLELPYETGGAAAWLAEVLDGTGPYPIWNGEGVVDLAALAAEAAGPQPPRPLNPQPGALHVAATAACQASHVALSCTITRTLTRWDPDYGPVESAERYGFGVQQYGSPNYAVMENSVRVNRAG